MNYYGYLRHNYQAHIRTYGLQVITYPANEQLTLQDAYDHLRLDAYGSPLEHPDDPWLLQAIPAAREWCEFYSGRSMAPQVLELSLPEFPHAWNLNYSHDEIRLPLAPIAGIESVSYLDPADGSLVALDTATYVVDVTQDIGYVYPIINTSWPCALRRPNAVRIRYHTGYTTPLDSPNDFPLPKRFRQAMLLVLGHLYENRENTTEVKLELLPLGAASLLDGMRLRLGFS